MTPEAQTVADKGVEWAANEVVRLRHVIFRLHAEATELQRRINEQDLS